MHQEYISKETSINTITKIYKSGYFIEGDEVLDFGGGKYNTNTVYLKEQGVSCFVYDPYNRTEEHNKGVLTYFQSKGGADIIVCANVLNVIKEEDIIMNILLHIKRLLILNQGSKVYIQIYEGNKTGIGSPTKKGYQRNQITVEYKTYIDKVFGILGVVRKNGNIYEIIIK